MTVITWLTPDLAETVARFRDRLGFHVDEAHHAPGGRPAYPHDGPPRAAVRLANGLIELVEERAGSNSPERAIGRIGAGERIADAFAAAPTADGAPRPAHPNGAAGLVAVGWGTVDHERAAASRAGVRFVFAGLDPLLGSAAWLATELSPRGRPGTSRASPTHAPPEELLLEPAREGPLAAALARHGEGPVAVYVRVLAGRWDDLHAELAGRGTTLRGPVPFPLGEAYLVRPERPWGPFLLFVRVPSVNGDPGGPGPAGA